MKRSFTASDPALTCRLPTSPAPQRGTRKNNKAGNIFAALSQGQSDGGGDDEDEDEEDEEKKDKPRHKVIVSRQ